MPNIYPVFQNVKGVHTDMVVVGGSFAPNGSSAVAATSNKGKGWTVARTSEGLFTVTFSTAFQVFLGAGAWLQLASAGDQHAQLGTWTSESRALQIRIQDISGAAVADIAADANNRVNFMAWFLASNTKPISGA